MFKVKNKKDGIQVKVTKLSHYSCRKFDNNFYSLHVHYDDLEKYSLNLQAHTAGDNITLMFSMATKVWKNSVMHTLNLMGSTKTRELNLIVIGSGINAPGYGASITFKEIKSVAILKYSIECICNHIAEMDNDQRNAGAKPFLKKFADIVKFYGNVDPGNNAAVLDKILQLFESEAELVEKMTYKPGMSL